MQQAVSQAVIHSFPFITEMYCIYMYSEVSLISLPFETQLKSLYFSNTASHYHRNNTFAELTRCVWRLSCTHITLQRS